MIKITTTSAELLYEGGRLTLVKRSTQESVNLSGGNEFVLYLAEGDGRTVRALPAESFSLVDTDMEEGTFSLVYEYKNIRVTVRYTGRGDGVFEKRVTVDSDTAINLRRLCLEGRTASADVSRGGEGQPVFCDNIWCGIEFPAAQNTYGGRTLHLMQTPCVTTTHFESLPVVYGVDTCGNLGTSFENYIEYLAMSKPARKIYCDWALHDELSPGGPVLTEAMTLENIERLKAFMDKTGTRFDYYLMDAFWFERGKPYTHFKAETFPNGPAPVVKALEDAGMKYGLWVDVNGIHTGLEATEEFKAYSTKLGNGSVSLCCDEFVDALASGIEKQIRECGIKMVKLDFAYFECKNPDHGHSIDPLESKERAIINFRRMIERLREVEPELVVLCYNGWGTIYDPHPVEPHFAMSPYWVEYVDYLSCSDPRPCDLPCRSFEQSIIWATDMSVREHFEGGLPLCSIDDSGTLLGKTDTIYRLGKRLFRPGVLMDVMRGSAKIFVYGDMSEIDDADCAYYAYVSSVYDRSMERGYRASFIGGDVRRGEVYGYSLSSPTEGYAVLLNPTMDAVHTTLSHPAWKGIGATVTVRIVDGELTDRAPVAVGDDMTLDITAGGYVLVEWSLGSAARSFDEVLLPVGEALRLDVTGKRTITVCCFNHKGTPYRTATGLPQNFTVTADEKELIANQSSAVWSGYSWACYELDGKTDVLLSNGSPDAIKVKYRADV